MSKKIIGFLLGATRRTLCTQAFDVAVVGGGPGGYVAAIRAAQLGLRTVCIEKSPTLGGTCLNVGCIPSKALLHATHKFHEAAHGFSQYGIRTQGATVDLQQLMSYKEKCVHGLTQGIAALFKANGVASVHGIASLASDTEIDVLSTEERRSSENAQRTAEGEPGRNTSTEKTRRLTAQHLILAPGSAPATLRGVTVDEDVVVSSTGALNLTKMPPRLIVIGAGVIGLELGSVYAQLGSRVTVVEFMDRVCPSLDGEIAALAQQHLTRHLGFQFLLGARVKSVTRKGSTATVVVSGSGAGDQSLDAERVLVAVGRRPATGDPLNLKAAGIEVDARGFIAVDDCLRVKGKENVFAIGDAVRGPALAHKAGEEGVAVAEFIAHHHNRNSAVHDSPLNLPLVNYDAIPSVMYTSPEVAGVGATEELLRSSSSNSSCTTYKKSIFPMRANSRARAVDSAMGMVKILTDGETGQLRGAWIMAENAGEMIGELALALHYGASAADVAAVCHAHPTFGEAIKEACLPGGALHLPPRPR